RMAEPENIVAFLENDLSQKLPLKGKKILITAGPTYEAIDPVRFIGNHATGKMGFDIAAEAIQLGAEVVLVSGPTSLKPSNSGIQLIRVTNAAEMFEVSSKHFDDSDVFIAAAAVADYKPKNVAQQKIKKSDDAFFIEFEKTTDILATLSLRKKKQLVVGFALETENEIENAKLKIQKKNLDLIVLNSLNDKGAGFGQPTNKVTFIDKDFKIEAMPLKSKEEVAKDILNKVIHYLYA
ncbi:MAG: bifunctional phosphopantothenoylcysteine decarboxylase/phosphopantothenate--cysteine ligase CoaBC, partial [Flavobacterium sp.]|nr:bifunctional phosphopantothenoylcysteine decarboxylase/phosphopantothenate--cysteine ligase CoaBC [Flavobacterium sp.]